MRKCNTTELKGGDAAIKRLRLILLLIESAILGFLLGTLAYLYLRDIIVNVFCMVV